MFDLAGKTALVTGAGQSVGAGIARVLAEQGAQVWVNDIVEDRAVGTADEIAATSGVAHPLVFDVTDRDAVVAATAAPDHIDILVNNAGSGGEKGMVPTQFVDLDPTDWEGPIDVNLYGVLNCVHAVLAGMIDRGWGRVITISSGAGNAGVGIGVAPYSAGKGGAQGFMRSLALEVASAGVTANSVALGMMNSVGGGEVVAAMERSVPVRRLGTPEDVAAICVYLASDEAAWTTGQTIGVNGGSMTS